MYAGSPDQRWGHISYAQHGDDFVILNIFEQLGVQWPSYLDIGAHHPECISNTALLYSRGCRGVNVECNPNLIALFEKMRPADVNVLAGVGPRSERKLFYMHNPTAGRNTCSEDELALQLQEGLKIQQTIEVDMRTIDNIVAQYCGGYWPNLLSVDIEGLDFEVLQSATFGEANSPWVVCVETRKHDTARMANMMLEQGYKRYMRMAENVFFVRVDKHKELE